AGACRPALRLRSRLLLLIAAVQPVRDMVGDGVGLFLRWLARLRYLVLLPSFAGLRLRLSLSLHARLLRLHRVRELVRDQLVALFGSRRKLARAEMHIATGRERARAELFRRLCRFA